MRRPRAYPALKSQPPAPMSVGDVDRDRHGPHRGAELRARPARARRRRRRRAASSAARCRAPTAGLGTGMAAAPLPGRRARPRPPARAPARRSSTSSSPEVGVAEQPPGSNDSPRIAQYRQATAGSGVGPWCAYFTSWAAREAGVPLGDQGQGFGRVDDVYAWAQRAGKAIPAAGAVAAARRPDRVGRAHRHRRVGPARRQHPDDRGQLLRSGLPPHARRRPAAARSATCGWARSPVRPTRYLPGHARPGDRGAAHRADRGASAPSARRPARRTSRPRSASTSAAPSGPRTSRRSSTSARSPRNG